MGEPTQTGLEIYISVRAQKGRVVMTLNEPDGFRQIEMSPRQARELALHLLGEACDAESAAMQADDRRERPVRSRKSAGGGDG